MIERYGMCYDECNNAWLDKDIEGEYVKLKDVEELLGGPLEQKEEPLGNPFELFEDPERDRATKEILEAIEYTSQFFEREDSDKMVGTYISKVLWNWITLGACDTEPTEHVADLMVTKYKCTDNYAERVHGWL